VDSPFRYVFIAVGVVIVGRFWLVRPAPFLVAVQRSGWWLAIAVLSSLSMLVFVIGIGMGQLAIGMAALVVGAPPTWFLFIRFIRDRPRPPK
jgi:hypothetical protein